MPSTYSSLKFELIATGEQAGTWGNTTNINIGTAIEEAITGSATVTFTSGANTAIALTNTNAAQAARNLRLDLSGTMTTSQYLYVPAIEKFYIINNTLSNTVIVSNGSNAAATGTAVSVPRSTSVMLFNDGVNVTSAISHIPSLANVTITSGNATVTNLTATSANLTNANVTSVLTVAAGTNAAPSITFSGDTNTGIYSPGADTVAIGTGGTERVRVVSAGDVGVGTSTPATISNRTVLSINNASNGGALNLLVNGTETLRLLTDNSSFGYVYNIANQPLVFGTNNTERMRIDSSGNVGVGTTTPSSYTSGDQLVIASASGNGQMSLAGADNGNPTINFRRVSTPSTQRGYIQYDNTSEWMRFATNGSERMRIDSSGNVGVGTSSPANKLHVKGSSNYDGVISVDNSTTTGGGVFAVRQNGTVCGYYTTNGVAQGNTGSDIAIYAETGKAVTFFSGGSATERMRIDTSGNVGIGTSSPVSRLQVSANTGTPLYQYITNTSTGDAGVRMQSSTTADYGIFADSVNALRFYDFKALAERARITSDGFFLIRGTNNPGVGLCVGNFNDPAYASSGGIGVVGNSHFQNGLRIGALAGTGSRTVTADANGTLSAASDSSLKQEVTDVQVGGLAELMQVQPKAYKWLSDIEERGDEAAVEFGFFADLVAPIIPSAAPKGNDGLYGFYDRAMIAVMTKAIQELNAKVEALEAQLKGTA